MPLISHHNSIRNMKSLLTIRQKLCSLYNSRKRSIDSNSSNTFRINLLKNKFLIICIIFDIRLVLTQFTGISHFRFHPRTTHPRILSRKWLLNHSKIIKIQMKYWTVYLQSKQMNILSQILWSYCEYRAE